MFADTITITVNAVAKVLNRINEGGGSSEYYLREATGEMRLKIKQTSYLDKTRASLLVQRHAVEFTQVVNAVSPATIPIKRKIYAVMENDATDTVTDPVKFDKGLMDFLALEANLTKLINLEV